jgi:hypothetical protein
VIATDLVIGEHGGVTELRADALWELPAEIDKAEGLVALPDGRAMVAVDHKRARANLFLLEPPLP